MGDEKKGGNTILLTVIGIATLLVAIVGATFAYFTATVTDGDKGSSVIIRTATLAVTYNDGNNIVASGITPGWTDTKTISITNTTDYPAAYTFRWKAGTKNTVEQDELTYVVNCTSDPAGNAPTALSKTTVPGNSTGTAPIVNIFTNQVINAHTVISCSLVFTFAETNSEQNYNQTKEFYGTLELVAEAVSAE